MNRTEWSVHIKEEIMEELKRKLALVAKLFYSTKKHQKTKIDQDDKNEYKQRIIKIGM